MSEMQHWKRRGSEEVRKRGFMIYGFMGVQIIFSMIWMINNMFAIPAFGDTTEYINLSETLLLDEYRPILYPLFLKGVIYVADRLWGGSYQCIIYIIQSGICFFSIYYTWHKIQILTKWDISPQKILFFSLYVLSIPMVTFMNFSVLTDSLALSCCLLTIISITSILQEMKTKLSDFIMFSVSFLSASLLRANIIYVVYMFIFIVLIWFIIKKMNHNWKKISLILGILICLTGLVRVVNLRTQTPGIYGRPTTNLSFVLLDRIVWPNMSENWENFPDDVKEVISIEDAKKFDEHNNNVMYYMMPLIENKVGKKQAESMCKKMAYIVFSNHPIKVLIDIFEDTLCFCFVPISALTSSVGISDTSYGWNVTCCSTVTPKLTELYSSYYNYIFGSFLLIGLIIWLVRRRKEIIRKQDVINMIQPFLLFSFLVAFWFALGDGAPPNDRYELIGYVSWTMLMLARLNI